MLPGEEIQVETRGFGAQERTVTPILMGHGSSYPPHKHDRDALSEESLLEET